MRPSLYQALAGAPDPLRGHEPDESIYRSAGQPQTGVTRVRMPFTGFIPKNDYDLVNAEYTETDCFNIAWTKWGQRGPPVVFIHGVPTNRRQWYDAQKRVAHFARTLSFDLLGMGESDKPRDYGVNQMERLQDKFGSYAKPWQWRFDAEYILQVIDDAFPGENVVVVADDWGGGIATWFAALYNDRVNGLIKVDSIDFDGYPVSEIQAIGRTSAIKDEEQFMMAMGAFDQTLVQIYKTMVHHQSVYNQYKLRDIKFPYVDVDYERSTAVNGENADSMTLRLKYQAIRVLADRAAILAPALLLPFDQKLNPAGVPVENITMPVIYIWAGPNGDVGVASTGDSMMPSNQVWLAQYAYPNAKWYFFHYVESADHFVGTDRPRLVAEYIVNGLANMVGRQNLGDVCFGFTGIWKGDEDRKIKMLRDFYNM